MNESLFDLAIGMHSFLLPFAWLALAICVFVLVPMALLPGTRAKAGSGLYLASWLFGLTTWLLGAAVTFATFGWLGLIIGVMLFGVGVVPIGIIAGFFVVKAWSLGVSLIVMAAVAFAARAGGIALTRARVA